MKIKFPECKRCHHQKRRHDNRPQCCGKRRINSLKPDFAEDGNQRGKESGEECVDNPGGHGFLCIEKNNVTAVIAPKVSASISFCASQMSPWLPRYAIPASGFAVIAKIHSTSSYPAATAMITNTGYVKSMKRLFTRPLTQSHSATAY